MKKLKVICIIPARGGSKGIKNKNIKIINNLPLISYTIKAAKASKVCDKIFVSTDSSKIAKISKKYGAEVPFLRSKKFSQDFTTTEATLKNALQEAEKYYKTKYDICVFLACTNIFRQSKWIKDAVNGLKKNERLDSIFSVHKFYKHIWHLKKRKPYKILKWMNNYTSRQKAPDLLREDTGLASATRATFWRRGKRIGKKVKFIINTDSFTGIDIHDKKDLFIAECALKYSIKNKLIDYLR